MEESRAYHRSGHCPSPFPAKPRLHLVGEHRVGIFTRVCWVLSAAICLCGVAVGAGGAVIAWGGNQHGELEPCAQDVVALSSGWDYTLLLKRDGRVCVCGTSSPPAAVEWIPQVNDIVAISAGWKHALALRANGTVIAWGANELGQTDLNGLEGVIAIAAGPWSSLALRKDGTVVWRGGYQSKGSTEVPATATNVIAISAGTGNLALKGDGTVVGWGWDPFMANGLSAITNAVAVSAGCNEWIVQKSDGTFAYQSWSSPVPAGLTNVEDLVASPGNDHHITLALISDGTVRGWGYNFYAFQGIPAVLPGLANIVAVAPGMGHSAVLVGGGKPFITLQPMNRTVTMSGETCFRVRATGAYPLSYQWKHNGLNIPGATSSRLMLTNLQPGQAGEYSVEVRNAFGAVSSQSASLLLQPLQIKQQPEDQWGFIAGAASFSVGVQGLEPLYYQWQRNGKDLPGATVRTLQFADLREADAGLYSVIISNAFGQISSSSARLAVTAAVFTSQPADRVSYPGGGASFAAAAEGVEPLSYQWLRNGRPLPGATNTSLELINLRPEQSGSYSLLASNSNGQTESGRALLHLPVVVAWGDLDQTSLPGSLTNVLAVASGLHHNIALTAERRVIAWGSAYYGETNVPSEVTNIAAISTGGYAVQSQAITSDGKMIAWGSNIFPPAIPTTSNLVAFSSAYHGLALRKDGTVVAAGSGPEAQVPPGLSNVVAISAGYAHSLALKSDGTVVAWGYGGPNGSGRPDLDYGQATVPAGLTNVVAIAAAYLQSMALRADGTVAAWGRGWSDPADVPPGLCNVVRIAAGDYHRMALRADGTVVVWGDSWAGLTNIPPGLTNVVAIAAGGRHCLALLGSAHPSLHGLASDISLEKDQFSLSIPTESGRVYQLEYKQSLADPRWTELPPVPGSGERRTLTDPSASSAQRLYRVRDW